MNRSGGGGRQVRGWGRGRGRGRGRGGRGGRGRHGGRGGRNFSDNAESYVHNIGTTGDPSATSFTVAVQGCSHGELDSIYDALESYRAQKLAGNDGDPNTPAKKIDLLLCCGDVQTLRNTADFHSLNVPPKYKAMGDFHAYYSGRKVAPVLTIMIGGNHESSNYLQELHYGGWVAPNIYYLGAAGVVNLCKKTPTNDGASVRISTLRIAGVSGIYNSRHYKSGRFETPPYDQGSLRSVYHTREVDVKRMQALAAAPVDSGRQQGVDIMISHDWPRGIAYHGDLQQLLRKKPYFKEEIERNELGSPANEAMLHTLKPRHWFAAHLHVKFEALVRHGNEVSGGRETKEVASNNPNSATTEFHGIESNDGICPNSQNSNMETLTDQMTRFLSLDKCLPRRRHIQITHVEPSSSRCIHGTELARGDGENDDNAWLEYDSTWLAILRRTHGWTQRTRRTVVAGDDNLITAEEKEDVQKRFIAVNSSGNSNSNPLAIPQNFAMTAPPFDPSSSNRSYGPPQGSPMIGNPQTDRLLETLGLDHRITVPFAGAVQQQPPLFVRQPSPPPQPLIPSAVIHGRSSKLASHVADDENEIDLDDDQEGLKEMVGVVGEGIDTACLDDENEIDLDDDQEETGGGENNAASELKENEDDSCLVKTHDPDEIDLEESDDAAGDDVCFAPPSNIAKKPRTEG